MVLKIENRKEAGRRKPELRPCAVVKCKINVYYTKILKIILFNVLIKKRRN